MDMISILTGFAVGAAIGFFAERLIRGAAYKTRDEIVELAKRDGDAPRRRTHR